MAKKNKDDIDNNDELNDDRSENINDADDNFGLPDVEYTPVERDEEKKPVEDEPTEAERRSKADYIAASAASGAAAGAAAGSGTSNTGYTRYSRPKRESNAPKVILLILLLLVVAVVIWYFGFYKKEQDRLQEEQARIELAEKQEAERQRQAREAQEQRDREAAQQEADRLAAEEAANATPAVGETQTISARTGRYYIIVASALDADLAMDYAKRLNTEGKNIKILQPTGNNKFHRVAVGDYDTWATAESEAKQLKGTYGEEVWVVKF